MEYDEADVWITRVIERTGDVLGISPLFSNFLTLGAIPLLLTFLYFNYSTKEPSLIFRITQSLFAVMVSGIGYLIWYYDKNIMPDFFLQVSNVVDSNSEFNSIVSKYNDFFAYRYWKTLLFWFPLFPIAFFGNINYFKSQGLGTITDPSFHLFFIFTIYSGLITGVGLHLIINTLRCVGEVSQIDLSIDPLHPDGLGGMSAIGSLSIWTMGLASIASLGMPYTLQIAAKGDFKWAIYSAFLIYFVSLASIFIYPVVKSTRKAELYREEKLQDLRSQIQEVETTLEELESDDSASPHRLQTLELRHQRLREKYANYESVKLYPISIGVISRFAGSILLPLVFIILEFYLSRIL